MQSRPKFWIGSMVAIFIASFLVGFAPIRLQSQQRFQVQSVFAYEVPQPLYQSAGEVASREEEITAALTKAGLTDVEVDILSETLLTVNTFAYTEEQAERDHQLVTQALQQRFPGVQEAAAPGEQEERQPVATWGPFAFFTPLPQLRLGLDLQGGAHVVLRCLSSAEMSFVLPEDKPLTAPQDAEFEEGQYRPPFTQEQLVLRVKSLLQGLGANPEEVDVSVLGSRLVVETRPQDQREVQRQQAAIRDFLAEHYAGLEIEEVEPSAVFVDEETADKVKYIIEQRLFSLGEIREPVIQ
ncbi:MAG: hypothetical protein AB7Y46_11975, partial [Armatimonadota bacterium]